MKYPLVSIIIPTKNEEKNIKACLQSLKSQTYPSKNLEIILVDNFSTDKTTEIAKPFIFRLYQIGPERSTQRNFAAQKARGQYLLFLDADMTASPDLIKTTISVFQKNPKLIAAYLPEKIIGQGYWGQVRAFERSFYSGTPIDGLRFFTKKAFLKSAGFDEKLHAFEDWDLDKRVKVLGQSTLIDSPRAYICHHEKDFRLQDYLAKKSYYLKAQKKYFQKWGRGDPDLKKQFGPYYRAFGVFVEHGKWQRLLTRPQLFLGITFLRGLVGFLYLYQRFLKSPFKK